MTPQPVSRVRSFDVGLVTNLKAIENTKPLKTCDHHHGLLLYLIDMRLQRQLRCCCPANVEQARPLMR
jgi:hypothetical protein